MSALDPSPWDPTVHAVLERLVLDHGLGGPQHVPAAPPIAAFDFDNTCIEGDIGEAVLRAVGNAVGRDLVADYLAEVELRGRRSGYALCASLCGARTPDELEDFTERVLRAELAAGRIRYRPGMSDLIDTLHAHGWEVWIVSASQRHIVLPAAARLGVDRAHVLGMELTVESESGWLVAPAIEPLTMYQGKVEALLAAAGRAPVLAAGDSDTDGDLLAAAKVGLVVDRGEASLLARARQAGWLVQGGWAHKALA